MNGILLTKERRKMVDKIFEHPVDDGCCYSVYLKKHDETIWCDNKWDIYFAIDKAIKNELN